MERGSDSRAFVMLPCVRLGYEGSIYIWKDVSGSSEGEIEVMEEDMEGGLRSQ